MRLLQCTSNGDISLTEFFQSDIPKYAILSHRWAADEVTYADLRSGTFKEKTGYTKIQFCLEQANRDKLDYFWIDTCCIDKSNSAELIEAINSMFLWYQQAETCYVYLSDVSRLSFSLNNGSNETWRLKFRSSEWFTRTWTLQELIAPASVEFFSLEGERLGDKASLEQDICEATGVPVAALRGRSLSDFSISERLSWAANRKSMRPEDEAYSLLGIFDVSMPLIYSEGKDKALRRLREEIDKTSQGTKRQDFSVTLSLADVPHVKNFVGRCSELLDIHKNLSGDGFRKAVVLHGLGGIGKTQLSLAYAKQYRHSYSAIFWLNAKDEDSLNQSFARVITQISREHPSAITTTNAETNGNYGTKIDAVKTWLNLPHNTRWLLIYDNYDNPKLPGNKDPDAIDIRHYLPESFHGSIILTTRLSQVKIGHRIHVRKLINLQESLDILSDASGRQALSKDTDAIMLAKELDGLPLAITTAGAYLDQVAVSFSEYLRLYKESWLQLHQSSPEVDTYEDRMLHCTWQVSYDYIRATNELSAKLLCFWAYFDNQDIWYELFRHGGVSDQSWVRELAKDQITFHGAMRMLTSHGLAEANLCSHDQIESSGYSMHKCVHSWTIHTLNQNWDFDMARLAIKFVGAHVPGEFTPRSWDIERRLLSHGARSSHMILEGLLPEGEMAWASHELGLLFSHQGKLNEAQQMYERALHDKQNLPNTEYEEVLLTVNNLAGLYYEQGKLIEAEQMFKQVVRVYEENGEPNCLSVLNAFHNLGLIYTEQGKYTEAETMYQRSLHGYTILLGIPYTSILRAKLSLGSLYADQGKVAEAEEIYKTVLQGYENTWGPEHRWTVSVVNHMGCLYVRQRRWSEAEQQLQRALSGYEKALGTDHISTLGVVNNMGLVYVGGGKLFEAEQSYQRALLGYEKALGIKNMMTFIPALNTHWGFGLLREHQSDYSTAYLLCSKALSGFKVVLGVDHHNCQKMQKTLRSLQEKI